MRPLSSFPSINHKITQQLLRGLYVCLHMYSNLGQVNYWLLFGTRSSGLSGGNLWQSQLNTGSKGACVLPQAVELAGKMFKHLKGTKIWKWHINLWVPPRCIFYPLLHQKFNCLHMIAINNRKRKPSRRNNTLSFTFNDATLWSLSSNDFQHIKLLICVIYTLFSFYLKQFISASTS